MRINMPELLIELFCEEIPARMQQKAAADLKSLFTNKIVDAGLTYESAQSFVTPRRLTLVLGGVPLKSPDLLEEKKGPKVGAPQKAIEGFLRSSGLNDISEAKIKTDTKKGDFYISQIHKKGQDATIIIAQSLKEIILNFPWPKSMRWGNGNLRWVRPLHNIICNFGVEGEPQETIKIDIENISSEARTYGHRFLSDGAIEVSRFEDYVAKLEKEKVILDPKRRRDIIHNDMKQLAFANGFEVIEDDSLLDEVSGLVEWPIVLLGRFDETFLDVPEEVIITTLKSHQKCFCLKNSETGNLANAFILTSNLIASDGGAKIIEGNERVIRARLSDSRFFWELDQQTHLVEFAKKLENIIFHQKLGSQGERVKRITNLALKIAAIIDADQHKVKRAASLCKSDLVSEMVGEFPELQGLMGRYYALLQGENEDVAEAIQSHYRPQGPSEKPPLNPVSIAVALADKLDMLIGFWSIDEIPTGSKDPFALRRAALGVIRILVENELSLDLDDLISSLDISKEVKQNLLEFIKERFGFYLKDQGYQYDKIQAIFEKNQNADLNKQMQEIKTLSEILNTQEGIDLVAGVKRAVNILTAEEKKSKTVYQANVDEQHLKEKTEIEFNEILNKTKDDVLKALKHNDFKAALLSFASLRQPIDSFFNDIIVNVDNETLRLNRLYLLNQLRELSTNLANFSVLVS